jgi:hypothetical protein
VIIEINGSISGQRAAARPLYAFLWLKEKERREFTASPSGRVSPWRVRGRSTVLRRRSRWQPTRATCGDGAHRRASGALLLCHHHTCSFIIYFFMARRRHWWPHQISRFIALLIHKSHPGQRKYTK